MRKKNKFQKLTEDTPHHVHPFFLVPMDKITVVPIHCNQR